MFVVKNNGRFPVIIRDLNFHIEGGKAVDLDLTFRREMSEKSVDLQSLLRCKKLVLLNKSAYDIEKPLPPKVKREETASIDRTDPKNNELLALLLKEFGELKDVLKGGVSLGDGNQDHKYNDDTLERLAQLKAQNLTNTESDVKKNFDNIGNTTEKKDSSLGDMLDILNNLDGNIGE